MVCKEGFLHSYCVWQVLQVTLLFHGDEQSDTHLYNHVCG